MRVRMRAVDVACVSVSSRRASTIEMDVLLEAASSGLGTLDTEHVLVFHPWTLPAAGLASEAGMESRWERAHASVPLMTQNSFRALVAA